MLYLYIVRTSTKSSEKRSTRDVVHEEGRKEERALENELQQKMSSCIVRFRCDLCHCWKKGWHSYIQLRYYKKVLLNVI